MDICFATTVAGTMEHFVNPVAAEMVRRGHRIQLVTGDRPTRAGFLHSSFVIPMERGLATGQDLQALRRWVAHLKQTKPQVVVTGTPKASLLGLTAARIAQVPVRLYVMHGAVWDGAEGPRRTLLERAEKATIANSTHQLAVSDSLARLVLARRLSRRMPDVLGSGSFAGVDVVRFSPPEHLESGTASMCFVGRLNRDKGIDVLLRTVDRVRTHADVRLTVVGDIDRSAPPDGMTLDALIRHPHVDWVGSVDDVETYLRASSLLLFPTSREGLPQVPLEAQACGVPVVSWRVTGVVDAVRDGFTGLLVRFGDEEALSEAAVHILTNSDLRGRLSVNARSWAVDRFARPGSVSRTSSYIETCATGSGQAGW